MLTDAALEQLLALEQAATPGPWIFHRAEILGHAGTAAVGRADAFDWVCSLQVSNCPRWDHDAALIAALRTAAPTLLREAQVGRALIALARQAPLERYDTHGWIECVWCHATRVPRWTAPPRGDEVLDDAPMTHASGCAGAQLQAALATYEATRKGEN